MFTHFTETEIKAGIDQALFEVDPDPTMCDARCRHCEDCNRTTGCLCPRNYSKAYILGDEEGFGAVSIHFHNHDRETNTVTLTSMDAVSWVRKGVPFTVEGVYPYVLEYIAWVEAREA